MRTRDPLGDVAVRARGLAIHLLDRVTLLRLARSASSGALAHALEGLGYWPAPSSGAQRLTTADLVDRAIEHETLERLAVLVRWLDDRLPIFGVLFELELRDALRIRLRQLAAGRRQSPVEPHGGWPALRELRAAIAQASDPTTLARTLARRSSPYARPIAEALRKHGDDPSALETALDQTWARRARSMTTRGEGAVRAWVEDEIDLHNAWSALVGVAEPFLEGGSRLPRGRHASIAAEADEAGRRRRLAEAFAASSLAGVFDAPERGLASLEARSRAARIEAARRSARLDPIGASPILEVVLRLQAERADLRCVSHGVAAGLGYETIVDRLAVAS